MTHNSKQMTLSAAGRNFIKQKEGLRLQAYQDSANVWTIGYGHTKGVNKGDTCTKEQAESWLRQDIITHKDAVKQMDVRLTQNQFDALVSFCFNVGVGAFKNSTLYKKVLADPTDTTIAAEFTKWVHAGGIAIPGLITRRQQESNTYFA